MAREFDVIVAGHICLDIIPQLSDGQFSFAPGRLLEVGPAVMSTGGPVSNTGLALHKLGIATRLMGKIGADAFGRIIREIVAARDPDLVEGMIEVPGETSSYSVILSPPGADRMFLHCPGCNDTFGVPDVDYGMVSRARLFHFGYPPLLRRVIANGGAELIDIFRRVKATGATTSLDMSMPDPKSYSGRIDWPALLAQVLPYVDIYMPSCEETLFMLDQEEFRRLSASGTFAPPDPGVVSSLGEHLQSMGPSIVGLKLGTSGLYLATAGEFSWSDFGRSRPAATRQWFRRELWSPCFDAHVVGTTGAGDATIAGFLAGLLRGAPPEECVTIACAVGACNVEAADALGGLRTWEDTRSRLAAGWTRRELSLPEPRWQLLPSGVWQGTRFVSRDSRP
jgi:sugar/nucleoside kinase (ribokinase family)